MGHFISGIEAKSHTKVTAILFDGTYGWSTNIYSISSYFLSAISRHCCSSPVSRIENLSILFDPAQWDFVTNSQIVQRSPQTIGHRAKLCTRRKKSLGPKDTLCQLPMSKDVTKRRAPRFLPSHSQQQLDSNMSTALRKLSRCQCTLYIPLISR